MTNPIDSSMTTAEKEKRLSELRAAVDQLEQELKREEEEAQHELIDHLDDYFNVVESKFQSLREFWQYLKEDRSKQAAAKQSSAEDDAQNS